jgi:hypothetical protein
MRDRSFVIMPLLIVATLLFPAALHGDSAVYINSPVSMMSTGTEALFGPRLTCSGLTGTVVSAQPAAYRSLSPSFDGCSAVTGVSGKIALIDRGNCVFDQKVKNAQDAGAIGVIIANTASDPMVTMAASNPSLVITIPSAMITYSYANQIRGYLASYTVNVTMKLYPCDPPRVVVSRNSSGVLLLDGGGGASDSFTVTNLGDESTFVSVGSAGAAFFSFDPTGFQLDGKATQTVSISVPSLSSGFHDSSLQLAGVGVPSGLAVPVHAISATKPSGLAAGSWGSNRVDVAGTSVTQTTSVNFRNTGTGSIKGVAVSDVPWIQPKSEIVEIPAGGAKDIEVTVNRGLRVDTSSQRGSATGTLTLRYLKGTGNVTKAMTPDAEGPSLSAPVPLVDTKQPSLASGAPPPLSGGEVALMIAGMGNVTGSVGTFISDLSVVNSSMTSSVSDLKIYFTSAAGSSSFSQTLGSSASTTLSDIAKNVFGQGEQLGTMQLRSSLTTQLAAAASVFNKSNAEGTYGTALPVFRSSRGVAAAESIYLTGIRKGGAMHTNIYVLETVGLPASFSIDFLNANGIVMTSTTDSVAAFGYRVVDQSRIPEGAAAAIVTNSSSGRIAAFATPVDRSTGDTWAVTDWNRYYGVPFSQAVFVPVAGALAGRNNTYFKSDLTLLNTASSSARASVDYVPASGARVTKTLLFSARQSLIYDDVVVSLFGLTPPSLGYIVVRPDAGSSIVTSSRTYTTVTGTSKTYGTGVPALPLSAAMGAGQVRTFSGLKDSTLVVTNAGTPATFRTNLGLIEIGGQTAGVRVSLRFLDGKQLAAGGANAVREYTLQPYGFLQLNAIAHELLGDIRETTWGNIDNFELRIETAVNTTGTVIPYVTLTDNGTGDTVLRVE